MSGPKRYVPPHRRTIIPSQSNPSQRAVFEERFGHRKNEEFLVTLKSTKSYEGTDLPAPIIHDEVKPSSGIVRFNVGFQHDKLRELMRWFRNLGRSDPHATLVFPPALNKDHRKEIHLLADNFGLGTSSQGFGDTRFISVYTTEAASFGVGKISMTEEEKRKGDEVWFLVRKIGGPAYTKYSHNEINEMVIANRLDSTLQDLLDKNQDLLASDFEAKCQISETTNWREESSQLKVNIEH